MNHVIDDIIYLQNVYGDIISLYPNISLNYGLDNPPSISISLIISSLTFYLSYLSYLLFLIFPLLPFPFF